MTDTRIATVGELIAALDRYDPTTPVRLATQSGYYMGHTVGAVARTPTDAEGEIVPPTAPPVVWIGTGSFTDPLPVVATDALGWSR